MGTWINYAAWPPAEEGVPSEYLDALRLILRERSRGPWQSWWARSPVDQLEIHLDHRGVEKTELRVRKLPDSIGRSRIRATHRRVPMSVWAAPDRVELARADMTALLGKVSERLDLGEAPAVPAADVLRDRLSGRR